MPDPFAEPPIEPIDKLKRKPTKSKILEKVDTKDEEEYLGKIKKKNKNYLVSGLTRIEKERIASYILNLVKDSETRQDEIRNQCDENEAVCMMERSQIAGDDGTMPTYRTPMTSVTLEVIHANIINVFFSPQQIMRCIPTEQNDIPKTKKITVFGNWSLENELDIFSQLSRLWHASGKHGECPYIIHWVKTYGTEIKRVPLTNPDNPDEPLLDPDTKEALYEEKEEQKLLYNGPKLEVFSRKDYIQPLNAQLDKVPAWEAMVTRISYDDYLRDQLQGKLYDKTIEDIENWNGFSEMSTEQDSTGSDYNKIGKYEQEFYQWYGRLRINVLKNDHESEFDEYKELEGEYIALVHKDSETLCSLRVNKFPLQERPIELDIFDPDDNGMRQGTGIVQRMSGMQKAYDVLFNQYLFGTMQSNNPFGFFTPFSNMRDEPLKIKNGNLYPTTDPKSVNIVKLPPPDGSMDRMMEQVRNFAQLIYGISDYAAGLESTIDPSAPAKKAEIVVQQGSVRLNMIVKQRVKTFRKICRKWFLLYQQNMPPDKFMRVTGDSENNPWKFQAVTLQDFALNSLPDFELTGNVLNMNKTLEAQKKVAIYQMMIQNFLFNPATGQGLQAYHELTRWILDALEETSLSRYLPKVPPHSVLTPEEENAMFLQGDEVEPTPDEDAIHHLKIHRMMLLDHMVPEEVKSKFLIPHINKTIKMIQSTMMAQQVAERQGFNMQPQPGMGMPNGQQGQGAPQAPSFATQGAGGIPGFSG